ncbi:hypothetical protein, partial [Brevibacillus porteri]|uniref:hypothetical protein n=1 Tax=Brevibacillus porteri TaxID=2126350 RepID=UPI003633F0CC
MENNELEHEIEEYARKLELLVSDYVGFTVQFPLEISEDDSEANDKNVSMGVSVKFPINIPGLLDELSEDILAQLSQILDRSFNKTGTLDYDLFYSLTSEVSLSLIFEDYIGNNTNEKFEKIDFLNDLREISSRTYESSSVDIGIVYCSDNDALKDLKKLKDIDYIKLNKTLTLKEFFLNEKPFLKLIDNKSLAIAVDHNFKVFALLRKKEGYKSLSTIFENLFNEHSLNMITKKVISGFVQPLEERNVLSSSEQDIHKYILDLMKGNIEFFKNKNNVKQPKFKYIDVQNKKINFHTGNKFVISYYNGNWKLKHYN